MFCNVPRMTSCRPVVPQRISATGRSSRTPFARISCDDRFDPLDAHEHHLGSAKFGERLEIDRAFRLCRILVAGEKSDVRSDPAMGHWNSRVSRRGDRRGHAWHDFERNVCLRQRQRFLAAAPEEKRIAAF